MTMANLEHRIGSTSTSSLEGTHSLFFYGTLVHPAILSRILASSGSHLSVQNAVLPGYSTFKVKGADYPALLDESRKKQLVESQPPSTSVQDSNTSKVPGTLVRGLSDSEITFLDAFEGQEYSRKHVRVILDPNSISESNDQRAKDESLASVLSNLTPDYMEDLLERSRNGQVSQESCQVYVWMDELDKLDNQAWEFGSFAKDHSHKWVGPGLTQGGTKPYDDKGEASHAWQEYSVVDKLRETAFDSSSNATIHSESVQDQPLTIGSVENGLNPVSTASVPDPWKEDNQPNESNNSPAVEPANPWASTTHSESIPTIKRNQSGRKHSSAQQLHQEEEEEGFEFGMEKFGHSASKWWNFQPGYTNLNNGSFGACPKPVIESFKQATEKVEEQPDFHILKTEPRLYEEATERLSPLLNVPSEEIALVFNATTATNAILRDLKWEKNDGILCFSTLYGAVERTFKYLNEMNDNALHLVTVDIKYPLTHDQVLEKVEKTLKEVKENGKIRLRLGIIDAITSNPGVIVPWERLVKLLRENGILSFVDAAHAIGQIPLDLSISKPDFFVSNCHKWLYAKRGCAVFHVPKRNQHLNRSSLPTSWWYTDDPSEENNSWKQQWKFMGTAEMGTLTSVISALDFRLKLGGEKRIRNYNSKLAKKGGLLAAKILETEVLENELGELTAAMTNVRLPLINSKVNESNFFGIRAYIMDNLTTEFKTVVPIFRHDEKVWARFSAQIWLEPSDFEYGARALKVLCQRINSGEVSSEDLKKKSWL